MNKGKKAIWLCVRCADKQGVETESEPVILKACSACGIENWVRPFGHAGADMVDEAGEVAESIPHSPVEGKWMSDVTAEGVEEPEEAAPSEAVAGIVMSEEEAQAEGENVIVAEDYKNVTDEINAQIAALEARKKALEDAE